MEMWKQFNKENYGRETIQTGEGFVVFKVFNDGSAYIHIMYVLPSFRRSDVATKLEQQIIKEYNVTCLTFYVDLTSDNKEESMKAILASGYKVDKLFSDKMTFYKKVANG